MYRIIKTKNTAYGIFSQIFILQIAVYQIPSNVTISQRSLSEQKLGHWSTKYSGQFVSVVLNPCPQRPPSYML